MVSRSLSLRWWFTLGALILGVAGCNCGGETPPPPTPDKELPDAARSKVEVNRSANVTANGKDSVTITVTVVKEDGTALADRTVKLEVTGEGNTLTPASGQTNPEGVMTASLSSTSIGSKRVTASVEAEGGPVVLGTRPTVDFVGTQATKLAFSAASFQATAGAPLNPVVQVVLQDADGNKAAGSTGAVTLELATGPASAQLEGTLTANAVDGVALFPEAVLKKAGTGYSLRASSGTLTAATSPTFDVVPAAPSVLELTGLPATLTAGGTADVQVVLKDAFTNVATNYTGTLRFTSTDPSAVLPADSAFTAADAGQKAFTALSLRSAGNRRVTVADTANATFTASADVQVVAGPASKLAFTQQPGNRSVRAALATVQVALHDAFGNLTALTAPAVTVALTPASAGLSGTTTVAPLDGVASFSTLSIAQEGTGYTLTASAPGLTAATSTAFNIVDDVAPAQPVLIQGTTNANSIAVGWTAVGDDGTLGTATSQELRYSTSNIVSDADFAAATPVTTGAPQAAGSAESVTLSGLAPSTNYYVALKVTDNASNSVRSVTLPVSTSNPSVAQLAFTTQPANGTAGTALADVRVALQDASGNTVTSATSAVTLNLLGGPAFTPVTVNAVSGIATFSGLRVDTAGTGYQFEATAGPLPAKQSTAFAISPAAAASLTLVGLVTPVASGASGTVDVTAHDAFGNVATGYTGTVHFTSTDAAASLPADAAFTAGDAGHKTFPGVVLNTSGSQTVTVTDTATASLTDSLTVNVVAGAAAQLVLSAPATPVTAGSGFSVQVTLRDGAGNIATSYTGTVHFSSPDTSAVLPADYTFTAGDAGQKTFTAVELRRSGAGSLTASDTASAGLTDTENVTVNAAAVASLELTAPASATAGSGFSVTVTAHDAFNNIATGYTGTVQFSADDVQASLPASYTFTGADAGSRLFTVTLGTAGAQPVRVTDGTHNDSATLTVGPGAAASLTITGLPAAVDAGMPASLTVTVLDAFGNVATGYTGTVHFTSSDASAVLPGDYTFSGAELGTASFSVELRTAGSQTLNASGSGFSVVTTATMTVGPGAPAQLVFSVQPSNGTVRSLLPAVSVALQDAYGNATTASSPTVTLGLSGGNGATLGGTQNVDPISGVATFSDLSIDQEATNFQFVAIAPGITGGATSTQFTIVDNIAPDAAMISATPSSATSATVTWTAVGDDGTLATATEYDLRYAATAITSEAAFSAATRVIIPAPQAPGSLESANVTGLTLTGDVYFALKVIDGAGNSSLSNSPKVSGDPCSGVTCTPPAATCSANGRSVVGYTSACVVSGNMGVCQDTPATTTCQSFETCSAAACVPVTAGSQAGNIIFSEFSALGAEFIELRNTTGAAIDVHGYTLRNAAGDEVDLRAVTDPNGTGGTPVMVPANGVLHGIPNPSGSIPVGTGFVYGAPGTTFALADTGDAIALYAASAGSLADAVDFRSFNTNPDIALTASNFVGFAGSTTQLEPTATTSAGNDTATNWCVSFYGSGVRGSRITNTLGSDNGSCKVAVINEVLIDGVSGDDGQGFIEIAGPGGSVIGGAKITDVEGVGGTAGTVNAFGTYTLPAGIRIPADGILLVADTFNSGLTAVANFVAGVDVGTTNVDFENGGGDSYQLVSISGTLLDALGHDVNGANLTTNVATANGLAMYETATALTSPAPSSSWAVSMARPPSSTDSDNNRNDFRTDPSPTPGLPNDPVNFTVASMTPDDGPNTIQTTGITVTGTDFAPTMKSSLATPPCTVVNATTATCTAFANAAIARVNVTFTNAPSVGVPTVVLPNGFTYTGKENETNTALEADFCNLQFPPSFSVVRNTMTPLIYGRIFEAGVTEAPGAAGGILAEVGYGTSNTDPAGNGTWRFFPATYNVQVGNDDEYMGSFVAPNVLVSTNFSYTSRFSQDGGLKWTYCDLNGAGSNPGVNFETAQLGVMTVTP